MSFFFFEMKLNTLLIMSIETSCISLGFGFSGLNLGIRFCLLKTINHSLSLWFSDWECNIIIWYASLIISCFRLFFACLFFFFRNNTAYTGRDRIISRCKRIHSTQRYRMRWYVWWSQTENWHVTSQPNWTIFKFLISFSRHCKTVLSNNNEGKKEILKDISNCVDVVLMYEMFLWIRQCQRLLVV